MKRLSWALAALIATLASFYLVQAGNEFIRWMNVNDSLTLLYNGNRIEFGLRNDGVVVWREITNMTNSPAEVRAPDQSLAWLTNVTFTNPIIIDKLLMTNNVP